jgi:hypothetical protein
MTLDAPDEKFLKFFWVSDGWILCAGRFVLGALNFELRAEF